MFFGKKFFFKIVLFIIIALKTQNLRILRGKLKQNVIFCVQSFFKIWIFKNCFFIKIKLLKNIFFFKIMLFKILFFFKIWLIVKFLIQNLSRCVFFRSKIWRVMKLLNQNRSHCENFVRKFDALEIFNSKSDKFLNFFSEIWLLACFSGSDWMMISSFNVNTNLF